MYVYAHMMHVNIVLLVRCSVFAYIYVCECVGAYVCMYMHI